MSSPAAAVPVAGSARLRVALLLARAASWLSRVVLRRGGGVIGGRLLLALVPDAPEQLARGREVVLVTGTNGKSTVTAMVAAALAGSGPVASNTDGANTFGGLAGALASSTASRAVLETDEGWLPWAVRRLRPRVVVLLNLSRDQLHRHPEVRALAETWRTVLPAVPIVVANCDDPTVAWAAEAAGEVVWVAGGRPWREDSVVCPGCSGLLRWDGPHWSCDCGRARPAPTAWPSSDGEPVVHLPGEVNRINARTALAVALSVGVPPATARRGIGELRQVAGRYAEFTAAHHTIRLLLAKNPASWQETLRLVAERPRPVVLVFNADGVDGRDPSWLYDIDFTALRSHPVAVSGRRATDLSVRLAVDEVSVVGQFADVVAAVRRLPAGPVDVVATYTAFQETWRKLA
jgi:UDP-N-acetylmuramyl tripeptide synthase